MSTKEDTSVQGQAAVFYVLGKPSMSILKMSHFFLAALSFKCLLFGGYPLPLDGPWAT